MVPSSSVCLGTRGTAAAPEDESAEVGLTNLG